MYRILDRTSRNTAALIHQILQPYYYWVACFQSWEQTRGGRIPSSCWLGWRG
ncbi:hypothetical protein B0H17DRAFT_1093186 [Mycena rosella]|uniref:Uncharacterized protein n=1 Tax=Mycena rosella TaxID=1033263 RepID=A0AAD7G358_MYCRO|nr:hypothetical protein B0H17DRAFT_1093186 [Mycena rosella]